MLQRGDVPQWSEDTQQEWLLALVSKQLSLPLPTVRVAVTINAIEAKMQRFDWPTIRFALDALGYNDAQLYAAIEQLKAVGLMSPAPAPPVTGHA